MISFAVRASLVVFLALASSLVSAQYLYRYTDEQGQTVLNSSIPPEYVSRGYEILDSRTGKLIERVDPQEQEGTNSNIVYLSPDDKILLASYSSVEEIQAHLARKTAGLRAEIANIETDMRILRQELEQKRAEQQKLVDREREIPETLVEHIAELEESDSGLAAALERREQDLLATEQEYEAKMARFEVLQNSERR